MLCYYNKEVDIRCRAFLNSLSCPEILVSKEFPFISPKHQVALDVMQCEEKQESQVAGVSCSLCFLVTHEGSKCISQHNRIRKPHLASQGDTRNFQFGYCKET